MATRYSLEDLVYMGIYTDGEHHKQWALVQIAKLMGIEVPEEVDEGIAP